MNSVVSYDIRGSQSSKSILLIHGAVVNRKMWIPQMASLAEHFQTTAEDMPGHGSLLSQPFTLETSVANLSNLITEYTTGKALIVGASLGGYVAMALAHKHANQCAGLVLAGANVTATGWLAAYLKSVSWLLSPAFIQPWLKRLAISKTRKMFPEELQDMSDEIIDLGVRHDLTEIFQILQMPWLDIIAEYQGPVLLLNGARDRVNRNAEAKFIRAVPQTTTHVIADCAHASNIEQPEKFSEAVREFYESIETEKVVRDG